MAKQLTNVITQQIANQNIKSNHIFKINSVDQSVYVINWSISYNKTFGSASATFTLNNNNGIFGDAGASKISVGDTVELIETFQGDSTEWKRFYGQVKSRTIEKKASGYSMVLSCLDYISILQNWDVDIVLEGNKIQVKNETLTPNFLPSPNGHMSQIFDFANSSVATHPLPILMIKDKTNSNGTEDVQFDGFEIIYGSGQVKYGFPMDAENNYSVIAKTYSHYTKGLYIEDILETLITTPDGYGNYLFGESSAANLIANHLTTAYQTEEGTGVVNTMLPNLTSSEITIETTLASDYVPTARTETTLASDYATDVSGINWEILYLTDTTGFPTQANSPETTVTAYIEDDAFTYTEVDGNTLTGLVLSGGNSITRECRAGDNVWYDTEVAVTELALTDTSGLPTSGVGSISGDLFTWTGIDSGNVLTGVSGLSKHQAGETFKYEATYDAGQVWYLSYSNVTSDLTSSDFTIPLGTFNYFDKRYGRVLLDSAISVLTEVTCDVDYNFKTLQATGVELNEISFRSRELDNRYKAIDKLRDYVAPNWIVRTQGDDKIWASYLNQNRVADYTLNLVQSLDYMEDKDLYTRCLFYAKNKNPENIMFDENITFVSAGHNYVGNARGQRLYYNSTTEDGWYVFKSLISDAGYITVDSVPPLVYIGEGAGAVPINNSYHKRDLIQARGILKESVTYDKVDDDDKDNPTETFSTTRYTYTVYVDGYANFSPDHEVIYRDSVGNIIFVIPPNDPNMNYVTGVFTSPEYFSQSANTPYAAQAIPPDDYVLPDNSNGITPIWKYNDLWGASTGPVNSFTNISTASFTQYLSSAYVEVDYDNALFKIKNALFQDPAAAIVSADFDYYTALTPVTSAKNIIDGRLNTQVSTAFFAEPPQGYVYAILDLGEVKTIQAIDLVAGFFKPEDRLKLDVEMRLTFKYSLDGENYYDISDKTNNFQLTGGENTSFEEDVLGVDFQTRYLSLIIESLKGVEWHDGVWPVAFSELSAYSNIVVKSEVKLISTTATTSAVVSADTTINVTNTAGFEDEWDSGEVGTAYIVDDADTYYSFTYTGITSTSFTGCTIESGVSEAAGIQVSQTIEDETNIYDSNFLLPKLGDRVYKKVNVDDEALYTQTELDSIAKNYLEEFYKNHTEIRATVMYSPFLKVGQTVNVIDTYNGINDNYFIESVSDSNESYVLVLARYREDS